MTERIALPAVPGLGACDALLQGEPEAHPEHWGGVFAMARCVFALVASELVAMGPWALAALALSGTAHAQTAASPGAQTPAPSRAWMTIGPRRFGVTLADTAAARAFAAAMPLSMEMAELNGNEKHADLREPLPASATWPGTIRNGDLLLYGTRTVVVFYATFDSSYSYTRLGRVDDPDALTQTLGTQGVRVTFSLQ